ncbi:MAG: DUF2917 domain-containing protein [Rhodocyclaceae bacterium]|nr:DUF2917 domain-containing protein [Rhodocyclaceae bacterium]MBX3667882.1 DUF2917 domain-containing protein [Rhodocyclaceae bacterium]
MKMQLIASDIHLAHGELLRIEGARGARLACRNGALLVSVPGCGADIELHAGDSFTLPSDACILSEAWGATDLSLLPPARAQGMAAALRGWVRRLNDLALLAAPLFGQGRCGA